MTPDWERFSDVDRADIASFLKELISEDDPEDIRRALVDACYEIEAAEEWAPDATDIGADTYSAHSYADSEVF